MSLHIPIMVDEVIHFFSECPLTTFVDGTLGAGGHASAILKAYPQIQQFYGFDQDEDALEIALETLAPFKNKITCIHDNFREMDHYVDGADGIFLDIGVSSMQLDRAEKGFSFSKEGPLDMRMDDTSHKSAADVINTYSEKKLGTIFKEYGEERRWRAAAKAIVEARRKKKIKTTQELAEALKGVIPWRGRKIHPLTLIFQALRIEVNDELRALQQGLHKGTGLLHVGGRIGVLSFHSLEDRIVKNTFREDKTLRILTKKPLQPSMSEMKQNPRSRSAKLRFAEKIESPCT